MCHYSENTVMSRFIKQNYPNKVRHTVQGDSEQGGYMIGNTMVSLIPC